MIYVSDAELDRLLLDDIQYGDLTTRALGFGKQPGRMTFIRRQAGIVSGVRIASCLLKRLDLDVEIHTEDGFYAAEKQLLVTAYGKSESLHLGWKVVQNVLEWCCGVANYTHTMLLSGRAVSPGLQLACTRKSIPGTKTLALQAIIDGGALIHRAGTAETILLFANHRRFLTVPEDWQAHVSKLRKAAPEKFIIVEADTVEQATAAMVAGPDMIQLDKIEPDAIPNLLKQAKACAPLCRLSVAGGVNASNIAQYAATGIDLVITSAPYYSPPADIQVVLAPQ